MQPQDLMKNEQINKLLEDFFTQRDQDIAKKGRESELEPKSGGLPGGTAWKKQPR